MLQLEGIVRTLPDEIGNLKELYMLVLSNNPALKSLPASIAKLDGLVLINLMGASDSLLKSLPQEITNEFDQESIPGVFIRIG
jgi:Leucine-rich repeat (LRR) protein